MFAGESFMPLMDVLGFADTLDEGGGQNFEYAMDLVEAIGPIFHGYREHYRLIARLLVICASESRPCPASLAASLPKPAELITIDRTPMIHLNGGVSVVLLAAKAYLKIGEVEKAVELARGGIADSKNNLAKIGRSH